MRCVLALLFVGGCASGVCDSCPSVTLLANGLATLDTPVGTEITYTWTSANADTATSTVAMRPTADACGNTNGPWVVTTLEGMTSPVPVLACQVGIEYTLAVTVEQAASGDRATAEVTVRVE